VSVINRESGDHEQIPTRQRVTIKDIAREAGVSETTVSLAFRPQSRISKKTREKVLAIGDRLHYVPNSNAQALRLGASNSIGFLVNDITNPFYSFMVRNAETIAESRGYQAIFAEGHWDPDRERHAIESMICSRVRGTLLCPCEKSNETISLLERHSVPYIVVDTAPDDYRGALVGNNLVAAGELAAKHLLAIHCRKVAMLTADRQMSAFSAFQNLKRGFLGILQKHGISPDSVPVVNAGLTIDTGKYGFERLYGSMSDVDGVFCANDLSAIGVMEAADARNIRIGQDLAVIGIDDLDISATPRISLTSIRQPHERIVVLAVNALIDSIETPHATDVRLILDPELILRNSTRRAF
jgi:LacI family transcriptional regulator